MRSSLTISSRTSAWGNEMRDYDIIVVGGGHAGIEAAHAAAVEGFSVLLVTQDLETIGRMSCNPAIGGLAKGNLVREIDALGGVMGQLIDSSMIQFRILNRRRGPAVQAPRAQADKAIYSHNAKRLLEGTDHLELFMDTVTDFVVEDGAVIAVVTERGWTISCRAIVLTTGTFMDGRIFIGSWDSPCGRLGEKAAIGLGDSLRRMGVDCLDLYLLHWRGSVPLQETVDCMEELIRQGHCGDHVLPIRPVILAGDDVCFVTAGNLGLECARVFLEKLTARSNEEDRLPYAACAGVALVHQKYPFHQAYQLSEELCSSAKQFGARLNGEGKVSALDWHIEFGQLKENLAQIRADYRTEDGGILSLRPVAVVLPEESGDPDLRTYDFFRGLCKAMQGEYGKTARGKIKDLRTAFKQGELESRFFLQDKGVHNLLYHGFEAAYQGGARWEQYRRLLTQGGGLGKDPFRTIALGESSVRHCLFFDAIEMIDHCDFLEEVEA